MGLPTRRNVNVATLLGIFTGILLIISSVLLSAEEPGVFLNLPGLLIVLGGTIAATFISYPMTELRRIYGNFRTVLRQEQLPVDRKIQEIVRVSMLLGRGDLAKIEDEMAALSSPFLRTGIQLVIDRIPPQDIDTLLRWRIFKLRRQEQAEAEVFHSMASFAPAFGMVGTLLALVNMMLAMGDVDFVEVGRNLGIALTTTLYGIVLSNLLFRPVALKLERRTEQRVMLMYLVLEGISMLGQNRNPSFIRETLKSFVAQYEDEISAPSLEQIEAELSRNGSGTATAKSASEKIEPTLDSPLIQGEEPNS